MMKLKGWDIHMGGGGTGSGWYTRCSKQKIRYMALQAGDYH